MKYIPAVVPSDLCCTRAGLLWEAANIVIDEPDVEDAVAEASRRAGVAGDPVHTDIDSLAVNIARSRVPSASLNSSWPSSKWRTWQHALDEAWPILADAAGSSQSPHDLSIGLEPGRWET